MEVDEEWVEERHLFMVILGIRISKKNFQFPKPYCCRHCEHSLTGL